MRLLIYPLNQISLTAITCIALDHAEAAKHFGPLRLDTSPLCPGELVVRSRGGLHRGYLRGGPQSYDAEFDCRGGRASLLPACRDDP